MPEPTPATTTALDALRDLGIAAGSAIVTILGRAGWEKRKNGGNGNGGNAVLAYRVQELEGDLAEIRREQQTQGKLLTRIAAKLGVED